MTNLNEAVYPRGKQAGMFPALSSRPDEAYVDFIADARNFLLHAQQYPIGDHGRAPRRCRPTARCSACWTSVAAPGRRKADVRPAMSRGPAAAKGADAGCHCCHPASTAWSPRKA